MIIKTRHTGIVVRDLSEAIDFYTGLGLKLFLRDMEQGKFIDRVVNLNEAKVETAKLKSPCGFLLELLQYHSHPESKEINLQSSNRLGCSHIAFTVISIDKTLKKIYSLGGTCSNPPATSSYGKVKVAYCHDLEGNLLEIVEELN